MCADKQPSVKKKQPKLTSEINQRQKQAWHLVPFLFVHIKQIIFDWKIGYAVRIIYTIQLFIKTWRINWITERAWPYNMLNPLNMTQWTTKPCSKVFTDVLNSVLVKNPHISEFWNFLWGTPWQWVSRVCFCRFILKCGYPLVLYMLMLLFSYSTECFTWMFQGQSFSTISCLLFYLLWHYREDWMMPVKATPVVYFLWSQ